MKKDIFILLVTLSIMAKAQNKSDSNETESQKRMTEFSNTKRHSLSLDVIAVLIFPALNSRYEYVLNKYSSIGTDFNLNFDDENGSKILEKFSFSPYYRQYFFSKEDYGAKGFYGEGFLKFYTYEDDSRFLMEDFINTNNEVFFETAIGVGIWWKWISDSGFVIDINGGLGRNFGLVSNPSERDFTGKFGINFGWQF